MVISSIPKLGTELLKILGAMEQPVTVLWDVWVANYEIVK